MPAHQQRIRVYYADTDAAGVAFHANVRVWAERARVEALREAGAPAAALVAEHGIHFMVRRAAIDYHRPIQLDDEVLVRTSTASLGGASCVVRHAFAANGALACRALVTLAAVRARDGRPTRIPSRWHAALGGMEDPTED